MAWYAGVLQHRRACGSEIDPGPVPHRRLGRIRISSWKRLHGAEVPIVEIVALAA